MSRPFDNRETFLGLAIFSGAGILMILGVLTVLFLRAFHDGPRPPSPAAIAAAASTPTPTRDTIAGTFPEAPPAAATPIELAELLKRKGLAIATAQGRDSAAVAVWFVFDGRRFEPGSLQQANTIAPGLVYVERYTDQRFDAAEANRNLPDNARASCWAWRQFWFQGDPDCVARIKKALGEK